MRVRLLGTAAGGAFPQWNCNCGNCQVARTNPLRAKPRTQSCIAISSDGARWFLVNASPDIRIQIEAFPPLWPPNHSRRGTGIAGVLLTNADLDHTLGLLSLREGSKLVVHSTAAVREALNEGLNVQAVFDSYCGIEWREPPNDLSPLLDCNAEPSGLLYAAFVVAGKPPRYRPGVAPSIGDAVGYRFVDATTGGRLVVLPDMAAIDENVMQEITDSDILLLDGTFFDNDEMRRAGVGSATVSEMGHLPVGGGDGSLARIAKLVSTNRIYVHVNNTNPMLLEDSPQRAEVEAKGVKIGYDGMEFSL
jgi:pyrroloquinoline quinone biosynthesis protein B